MSATEKEIEQAWHPRQVLWDVRDLDVLLDQYANALLLHKGDRHAVDECEHCRVVRERIHSLFRAER